MALSAEEVIYNLALGDVGEYQVTEGQTTDKQYELCSRFFDITRKEVLIAHPWNEAKLRIIIVQDATNPIFGYDRRYSKPSDNLKILSVNDSLGADLRNNARGVDAWEPEGDYILANAGETPQIWKTATSYIDGEFVTDDSVTYEVLVSHTSDTITNDVASGNIESKGGDYRIIFVEYIFDLTDISKFSPKLKEAIAKKLASRIITGLTNDTKGKIDLINEFEQLTMPQARSVDAQEGKPIPFLSSSEWIRSRSSGTQWP